MAAGERIRALVVDDSVIIRRLVTHALGEDPDVQVVGSAANGVIALKMIPLLNPDVVTLDIEMPEMDGLRNASADPQALSRFDCNHVQHLIGARRGDHD